MPHSSPTTFPSVYITSAKTIVIFFNSLILWLQMLPPDLFGVDVTSLVLVPYRIQNNIEIIICLLNGIHTQQSPQILIVRVLSKARDNLISAGIHW